MKTIINLNSMIILGAIFFSSSAYSFEVGGTRHDCRPPKFRSFFPPERVNKGPISLAEPESEISFTVSASADPESIRIVVKKQPLVVNVVDKQSFFQVTAKLPAALNGKYARIDIWAKDKERDCKSKDGWLIKIKKVAEKTAAEDAEKAVEKE